MIYNKRSKHSAGVSPANAAKPSPNVQNFSVQPLPSKARGYVKRMVGEALVLKPKLADNVALKPKPSMATRRAKRETNAA